MKTLYKPKQKCTGQKGGCHVEVPVQQNPTPQIFIIVVNGVSCVIQTKSM